MAPSKAGETCCCAVQHNKSMPMSQLWGGKHMPVSRCLASTSMLSCTAADAARKDHSTEDMCNPSNPAAGRQLGTYHAYMDVNKLLLRPRKLLSTPTTKPLSFGKLRTQVTRELVSYHTPMFPATRPTQQCSWVQLPAACNAFRRMLGDVASGLRQQGSCPAACFANYHLGVAWDGGYCCWCLPLDTPLVLLGLA